MKKSKLLTYICVVAGVIAPTAVLSSCSCQIGGGDTPTPPTPPTPRSNRVSYDSSRNNNLAVSQEKTKADFVFDYDGTNGTKVIVESIKLTGGSENALVYNESAIVEQNKFTISVGFQDAPVSQGTKQSFTITFSYQDSESKIVSQKMDKTFSIIEAEYNAVSVTHPNVDYETFDETEHDQTFIFTFDEEIKSKPSYQLSFEVKSETSNVQIVLSGDPSTTDQKNYSVKLHLKKTDGKFTKGDVSKLSIKVIYHNNDFDYDIINEQISLSITYVVQSIEKNGRDTIKVDKDGIGIFTFKASRELTSNDSFEIELIPDETTSLKVSTNIDKKTDYNQLYVFVCFDVDSYQDRWIDGIEAKFDLKIKWLNNNRVLNVSEFTNFHLEYDMQPIQFNERSETTFQISDTGHQSISFTVAEDIVQSDDTIEASIPSQSIKGQIAVNNVDANISGRTISVSYDLEKNNENLLEDSDYVSFDLTLKCSSQEGITIFTKVIPGITYYYKGTIKAIPTQYLDIEDSVLKNINVFSEEDKEKIKDCNALVVPSDVTEIAEEAVTEGKLPETIKTLSFAQSVIPENELPLTINKNAFLGSTFREIILPKRLSYVSSLAFNGMNNVEVINASSFNEEKINANNPFVETNAWGDSFPKQGTLFYQSTARMDIYNSFVGSGLNAEGWMPEVSIETEEAGDFVYGSSDSIEGTILMGFSKTSTFSASELIIPYDVTYVQSRAFAGTLSESVKSVTVAEESKLKKIGSNAFANNPNLETVSINHYLKTLGTASFQQCDKLKNVYISSGNWSISSWLFYKCPSLSNLVFDDFAYVEKIGIGSFQETKSLTEFDFSYTTWIGAFAFAYSGLMEIKLNPYGGQDTINYIGYKSFMNCEDATSIRFVGYGESKIYIDQMAFYKCSNVTNIFIIKNVMQIGGGAFSMMNRLSRIDIPDDNANYFVDSNYILSKPDGGKTLVSVPNDTKPIPRTVETIGRNAFYGRYISDEVFKQIFYWDPSGLNLKRIEPYAFSQATLNNRYPGFIWLPSTLEEIDEGAFAFFHHPYNDSIYLSESTSLTQIDRYAFAGDVDLKLIALPEGLSIISSYAFSSCTSLESATIPSTTTFIGYHTFGLCDNLKTIDCSAKTDEPTDSWCHPFAFDQSCGSSSDGLTIYINNDSLKASWVSLAALSKTSASKIYITIKQNDIYNLF